MERDVLKNLWSLGGDTMSVVSHIAAQRTKRCSATRFPVLLGVASPGSTNGAAAARYRAASGSTGSEGGSCLRHREGPMSAQLRSDGESEMTVPGLSLQGLDGTAEPVLAGLTRTDKAAHCGVI